MYDLFWFVDDVFMVSLKVGYDLFMFCLWFDYDVYDLFMNCL